MKISNSELAKLALSHSQAAPPAGCHASQYALETSQPGIFAIGDMRSESISESPRQSTKAHK
jgi:thioredoxin reductase